MALSGSFSNSVHSGHYGIKVDWTATQNVTNNTSTITAKIYFVNDWAISIGSRDNNSITIAGKTYNFTSPAISGTGTKLLATITSDPISHNADGSKSVSISCSFYMNATISGTSYYGWITASTTATLNTIARASQPSCITYPNHTQNVGEFGDTISIHMNRNSSSFTHTVRYAFGQKTGTCIDADTGKAATAVTTGFRWKIPEDFMNLLTSVTYGSGTIYVDTYNGSTKIGTKSCGFTATIPASVKPTCTIKLEEPTGMAQYYGSPVKGLSKIKITVTAKTAYSSPIASYSISANGTAKLSATLTTLTTDYLKTSGYQTITVTVKDKRGRSYTVTQEIEILNYTAPKVSSLSVRRCNSDGTANDRGEYVKATFSAAISSMSNNNTATYTLKYKKSTASSYTTISLSALANKYSVSNHEYVFAADGSSSYDVEVSAADRHNTASRSTSASTAFTLMNFNPKGNGLGIGQVSEKENTLQIGLDVEFKNGQTIFDLVYPVGSIYLAYNHTNPGTLFPGTTWTRIYGAFPWFTDANGQIGMTGGERTVTLTENQIPAHNHGGTYTNAGSARTHAWLASGGSAMGYDTINTGGGEAHNNMPPYIQISAWRRTA